jgi:hypothetical protein
MTPTDRFEVMMMSRSMSNASLLVLAVTLNDMRGRGIERCSSWLSGKHSEGRNPTGGCGAK